MKPRLYLETTIPSYLTAWPSRDLVVAGHQQITKEWWSRRRSDYELFISEYVHYEAACGDPTAAQARLEVIADLPELAITENVGLLTARLLTAGLMPPNAAVDAGHLAVAAVHGMHFLLTWNCTHINNATIEADLRALVAREGYALPVICTPEELMGGLPA